MTRHTTACPPPQARGSALARMLTRITRQFEHGSSSRPRPTTASRPRSPASSSSSTPCGSPRRPISPRRSVRRVEEIVIRRLKSEINHDDERAGRPQRFVEREISPLPLFPGRGETALTKAFENLRLALHAILGKASRGEQMAGYFAIEVLQEAPPVLPLRLRGLLVAGSSRDCARTIRRPPRPKSGRPRGPCQEENEDDEEAEGRLAHASRVAGAWLRRYADRIANYVNAIDQALTDLGLVPGAGDVVSDPEHDSRFERLVSVVEDRLREGKTWRDDERADRLHGVQDDPRLPAPARPLGLPP